MLVLACRSHGSSSPVAAESVPTLPAAVDSVAGHDDDSIANAPESADEIVPERSIQEPPGSGMAAPERRPEPWVVATTAVASTEPTEPPKPQGDDVDRVRKWRERARIRVGQSHLSLATFAADERHLIVMSEAEATVRVYDISTLALVANHAVPGFVAGEWMRGDVVAWPDASMSAYLVGNSEGLRLYDLTTALELALFAREPAWSLRWSPDRRYLMATTADLSSQTSMLRFYERQGSSLVVVAEFATEQRIDDIALSHDNRLAAIATYPDGAIELIDLHTGVRRWSIRGPQYVGAIDISPDGKSVAVGGAEVWIVDVDDPSHRATYKKLGNNVHQVRFSPGGEVLAVTAYDGHARLLVADGGDGPLHLVKDLRHAGRANVYSAEFRRDGSGLVTSSGDRTVRLWSR